MIQELIVVVCVSHISRLFEYNIYTANHNINPLPDRTDNRVSKQDTPPELPIPRTPNIGIIDKKALQCMQRQERNQKRQAIQEIKKGIK